MTLIWVAAGRMAFGTAAFFSGSFLCGVLPFFPCTTFGWDLDAGLAAFLASGFAERFCVAFGARLAGLAGRTTLALLLGLLFLATGLEIFFFGELFFAEAGDFLAAGFDGLEEAFLEDLGIPAR